MYMCEIFRLETSAKDEVGGEGLLGALSGWFMLSRRLYSVFLKDF
jgi:hypothetical protein